VKILLFGANGQVGWELQRSLAALGQMKTYDRNTLDIGNFKNLRSCVRDYKPEIIVNAAAYTSVDRAESERDKALRINSEAVAVLADEAKKLNACLIHFSTDYVFDGRKLNAYQEIDKTNPQSVYGKTKLQGEEAIKESECNHLIFRTSWIYATRGANFAKNIIRLAKEKDELKVVNDQFGVPTSAELVADITALCLNQITQENILLQNVNGTYHLTPSGKTSWYGFAQYVISESLRLGASFLAKPENVIPISTSDFPSPAKRPPNSQLDTQKLRDTFKLYLPPWQTHVKRFITEIH